MLLSSSILKAPWMLFLAIGFLIFEIGETESCFIAISGEIARGVGFILVLAKRLKVFL
jgi:hypothetical protein